MQKKELLKQLESELDDLLRSKAFYEEEYKGKGKKGYLNAIKSTIEEKSNELTTLEYMPTIAELQRKEPEQLEDMLLLIINDLRLFFQVDNVISNEGLFSLLPIIIETYKSLTLEDLCICFLNAKKGIYGQIYNRLDGQVILGWLKVYNESRMEALSLKQQNQRLQHKSSIHDERKASPQDAREMLQKAKSAMLIEQAKTGGKS